MCVIRPVPTLEARQLLNNDLNKKVVSPRSRGNADVDAMLPDFWMPVDAFNTNLISMVGI